jgi:DNA-binding transcriptional ArsR family regulator
MHLTKETVESHHEAMPAADLTLIEEPDRVRAALTPLRRQLLARLREPASATQLAQELGLPRQRVNYHLRALETADLLELVEERQRRGCTERVLRAKANAFVVDPSVMAGDGMDRAFATIQDQYAAEHLVDVAAATVRNVGRMQAASNAVGTRLLTFTIETEVRFAEPGDLHRFTDAMAEAIRQTVEAFDTPDGRPYRVVAGGHPAPKPQGEQQ